MGRDIYDCHGLIIHRLAGPMVDGKRRMDIIIDYGGNQVRVPENVLIAALFESWDKIRDALGLGLGLDDEGE